MNGRTPLILVVAASAWWSSSTPGQSGSGNVEDAIVRSVMIQATDAFNRHDAKAWAQLCTPDARLVTVRGESMDGIAQIERGLAAIFETRAKNATLRTLDITVRFIRPDVALAYATNQMSGVTSASGEPQRPHTELSIRVLAKERGVWRIAAFHTTIVQQ